MAVKHVTIYECDACEGKVKGNGDLTKLTIGVRHYELCPDCTQSVERIIEPILPDEDAPND